MLKYFTYIIVFFTYSQFLFASPVNHFYEKCRIPSNLKNTPQKIGDLFIHKNSDDEIKIELTKKQEETTNSIYLSSSKNYSYIRFDDTIVEQNDDNLIVAFEKAQVIIESDIRGGVRFTKQNASIDVKKDEVVVKAYDKLFFIRKNGEIGLIDKSLPDAPKKLFYRDGNTVKK